MLAPDVIVVCFPTAPSTLWKRGMFPPGGDGFFFHIFVPGLPHQVYQGRTYKYVIFDVAQELTFFRCFFVHGSPRQQDELDRCRTAVDVFIRSFLLLIHRAKFTKRINSINVAQELTFFSLFFVLDSHEPISLKWIDSIDVA